MTEKLDVLKVMGFVANLTRNGWTFRYHEDEEKDENLDESYISVEYDEYNYFMLFNEHDVKKFMEENTRFNVDDEDDEDETSETAGQEMAE